MAGTTWVSRISCGVMLLPCLLPRELCARSAARCYIVFDAQPPPSALGVAAAAALRTTKDARSCVCLCVSTREITSL
jgi:hypothetical protein